MAFLATGIWAHSDKKLDKYEDLLIEEGGMSLKVPAIITLSIGIIILFLGFLGTMAALMANELLLSVVCNDIRF